MIYAPECVYFPQYDITCPVDPVGYNWRGEMATVRSPFRAGWLKYSGDPVTGGNVILAGHNRYSGKLGYFSVVKDKLQPGDQVIVKMQNGEYAYYIVESINQYHYQHVPWEVMQHDGESRLTLITCLGDFSSSAGTKYAPRCCCMQDPTPGSNSGGYVKAVQFVRNQKGDKLP